MCRELDNFDDNGFAWWKQFREAKPGNPLFDNGMKRVLDLVASFNEMLEKDTLPQVYVATTSWSQASATELHSPLRLFVCVCVCVCVWDGRLWIVGPTDYSEHATHHPANGEQLSSRLVAALQANPAMYAKTAFILNYDEGCVFCSLYFLVC